MQRNSPPFRVIQSRGPHLVVSTPNFHRFIIHEFTSNVQRLQSYLELAKSTQSDQNLLIPVINYSMIDGYNSRKVRIVTQYYQYTLKDMMKRKGKFDEQQLVNTMDEILNKIKVLYGRGVEYGMLSPSTVCFYKNEIVLGFGIVGEEQEELGMNGRERKDVFLEKDLRSLGVMILDLAVRENGTVQQLLQFAETKYKYSPKFVGSIKKLIDPIPSNRTKIWQTETVQPITLTKKQNTLSESNAKQGMELFTDKISKLNEVVTEYLRRSKRIIERSENSRRMAK